MGEGLAAGAGTWPASLAGFPLGQRIADARRHGKVRLGEDRVAQLAAFGMIWDHHNVDWKEGLAAACGWADQHGHPLAPADATWNGYPVGIWLKNSRGARRRTTHLRHSLCR